MIEDLEWFREAACIGEDIEIFFDLYETDPDQAKETDRICASCPVRMTCLVEAIENDATGVFGGAYLSMGNFSKQRNKHKSKTSSQGIQKEIEAVKKYTNKRK